MTNQDDDYCDCGNIMNFDENDLRDNQLVYKCESCNKIKVYDY